MKLHEALQKIGEYTSEIADRLALICDIFDESPEINDLVPESFSKALSCSADVNYMLYARASEEWKLLAIQHKEKPLDPFQAKAILALAIALKRADDADPDVGMGATPISFVETAAKKLEVEITHGQASLIVGEWIKSSKGRK